jgi:hypothetical protein
MLVSGGSMITDFKRRLSKWLEEWRTRKLARRTYYILDAEELLPGDVILSTPYESKSFFIRLLTLSWYSHAAIYLGNHLYAEAVGIGVRVRSVDTIVKKRIKVIRLKNTEGLDAKHKAIQAVERVDHYLHLPYWLHGALLSGFVRANVDSRKNMFCSHLVAQCYADVYIDVAGRRKPENITPGRFARSHAFYDVTKRTVIHAYTLPEHLILYEFKTLSDKETQLIQTMVDSLVPVFERRIKPVPPNWYKILALLAEVNQVRLQAFLDKEVVKVMRSTGYLTLTTDAVEEIIKPLEIYLASIEHTLLPRKTRELESVRLKNDLIALREQLEIHKDNRSFYAQLHIQTRLTTFKLLEKYQIEHCQNCRKIIELSEALVAALSKE